MTPAELRFEAMRERYHSQRDRREEIRNSVATPVAGLAFSAYTLSMVTGRVDVSQWQEPVTFAAMLVTGLALLALLAGALLIVRMEKNVIYIDPPDLQEMVNIEKQLYEANHDDTEVLRQLQDTLCGAYDIICRRYFASNEQAARDRTRGLHLILLGLALIMIALVLLPFQGGAA